MSKDSPENYALFPLELLERPSQERLDFFAGKLISHPYIERVRDEVIWAIEDSTPGSIILCCGAPGVGKTTVMKDVANKLIEQSRSELEADPGRLAVASIRIRSPQTGNFDWKKHYFKPLLISMEEPLVDKKIDMSPWAPHHRENLRLIANRRADGEEYRGAVEDALRYRRPKAVLIDDAQHAGIIGSGRSLLVQTNTFKSMADQTGVTHVLYGTYELLPFRNMNGQLSRRSVDIHFSRYRASDIDEREHFVNALNTFERCLPLKEPPNLVDDWEFFYEHSLGCIGVLKDWLTRSYSLALRTNAETITREHLEARALSISQLNQMLTELTGGEDELEESVEKRQSLRSKLKLDEEPRSKIPQIKHPVSWRRNRMLMGIFREGAADVEAVPLADEILRGIRSERKRHEGELYPLTGRIFPFGRCDAIASAAQPFIPSRTYWHRYTVDREPDQLCLSLSQISSRVIRLTIRIYLSSGNGEEVPLV